MFSRTAELYDLIYQQFKDYAGECRRIADLLARLHPQATRLLDVACGTGEHARVLAAQHGYQVDGLDIEPEFIRIARSKNPGGEFFCADMIHFELQRRYDIILCLFSSIGYARTLENVGRALATFRRHLSPGGLVVLEPWFAPEQWRTGTVHLTTAEGAGLKVCRMSSSTVRERVSVLDFQYLIGSAEGIEHRQEVHELGLFTTEEMRRCFAEAGLDVLEHDAEGLTGRGLYAARAA